MNTQTFPRWLVSAIIASVLHLGFFLVFLKVEPQYRPQSAPLFILDYVVLPLQEKPVEEPEPPPPPEEIPEEKIVAVPEPMAIAPVPMEVTMPSPVPVEIVSAPVKEKARLAPAPALVTNIQHLDNTDFVPLYNPKPEYPLIAKRAGIEGEVVVQFLIDKNGKVKNFSIVSTRGHQQFALETSKVIRRWRFPPPRVRGQATMVRYERTVTFRLE